MVTVVPATVVAVDTVAQVVLVLVVLIFLINLRIIPDVRIVSAVAVVPATVVAVDTVARVVHVLVAMIFQINLKIILDVRIVSVVAKVVKLDCILKRGKNRLVVMGGKIVKRVKKTKTWIINIKIGPPSIVDYTMQLCTLPEWGGTHSN